MLFIKTNSHCRRSYLSMQEQGHLSVIAINLNFLFQYLRCFKKINIYASSTLNTPQTSSAHTSQWCLQVKEKFKATELRQDNSLTSVNAELISILSQSRILTAGEQRIPDHIILHSHYSLQATVFKYQLVLTIIFE